VRKPSHHLWAASVASTIAVVVFVTACGTRGARGPATTSAPPVASSSVGSAPGALSLLVEPDQGLAPIYALIASAHHTLDLAMYELVDTDAELALELAASRGVVVRVLLDRNREQAANQPAYDELTAMKVQVAWADSRYAATHEKALVVDGSVAAVMSLNLTKRYYASTRDFAVLDRDPADVASIERAFDADFRHAPISPAAADDLVWSPHQSATALPALIDSATSTLLVENEEMAYPVVTAALTRAAHRGVHVVVVMTDQSEWHKAFNALAAAHVTVRLYAANARLYIHAKAIVADAGTPKQRAFVGSENFSKASLNSNRELGLLTSDAGVVAGLARAIDDDASGAKAWVPSKS
jgi:cardiolipin synthase